MRKGDRAFFYHSNVGKEIVGVVEVVREAYPDPTAEEGGWVCVDMKAVGPMPKPVSLAAIKADRLSPRCCWCAASRLSVMPVSKTDWDHICRMAGGSLDPAMRALCAVGDIPEDGCKDPAASRAFPGCSPCVGQNVCVYVNACPHLGAAGLGGRFLSADGNGSLLHAGANSGSRTGCARWPLP